ncbi:hypothetical protein [Bacillus chungangensis]|uniref:Uncharacterized protein n=1 Tax=Bacillus chungangensis TaxID=587633 RepID=A0ABT9WTX0_9BACI|nr:hypothetical protein [Bacillus chungangensis]MDQ0176740.1 hypothetical protein [Bacillus chungangensis]
MGFRQVIGGNGEGPISADDVIETRQKQFLSADKKAQIDVNTSDVQSVLERISSLEENGVIGESDGRIKVHHEDMLGFLEEKIDNDTIQLRNNKLSVALLSDLLATIEEINQLQGVTGNVQAQIDALSNIGNFTQSVASFGELMTIKDMQANDMVIVLSDEAKEDKSTIYIYTGSSWQFSGEFKGGEIRDFKEKPLDINAETKGMLQKGRYESPESQEVSYSDPNGQMKSKNVRDALSELFQLANSFKQGVVSTIGLPLQNNDTREEILSKIQQIKTTLASNLMGKGVIAYPYNTLNEMVNKVKSIPNVTIGGNLKKITKLNIEAPYEHTITLEQPLKIEDVAVSVLEYVGDEVGVTHYEAEYNNGESENFDYDKRFVQFDGHMKLKENHRYVLTSIEKVEEDYELLESEEINLNDYVDFGNLSVDNDVTLTALPHTQIIKASGDIVIAGVESIDKMELINESKSNGQALLAISFDSGASYHAYKQGKWIVVNVNSVTDFLQKGMNKDEVNKLSNAHLRELRGESNDMRFSYLLSRDAFSDVAYNDKLKIVVTMQGYNVIADTKKYNYSYDAGSRTLTFQFNDSGTYTFNYVDGE